MGFWLQLGVSGFRMDAVPFLIGRKGADVTPRKDYELLHEMRDFLQWRRRDAILLAEANVPPRREPRVLRRARRPPADDAELPGQPAAVLRAGDRRHQAAGAGAARRPTSGRTAAQWVQLPAQPRRARSRPADRGAAPEGLRRVRPDEGHAALRPRHPPAARADARQRSAPPRARLQPAVHAARHADAAVRRRDRHGRRPVAARARMRAHADAVVGRAERRVLNRAARPSGR